MSGDQPSALTDRAVHRLHGAARPLRASELSAFDNPLLPRFSEISPKSRRAEGAKQGEKWRFPTFMAKTGCFWCCFPTSENGAHN